MENTGSSVSKGCVEFIEKKLKTPNFDFLLDINTTVARDGWEEQDLILTAILTEAEVLTLQDHPLLKEFNETLPEELLGGSSEKDAKFDEFEKVLVRRARTKVFVHRLRTPALDEKHIPSTKSAQKRDYKKND